jgi:hypothetical protein
MLKRNLFLAAAVVATMSCSAFADFSSLANLLAEKGIISYGEAQTLSTESKEEAKMKLASGKSELVPLWVQNMTFKGDVRIRTQYDWDASNQARLRERLRLRMGIETRPVEKIKLGFGLATGSLSSSTGKDADPSSTNHTFEYMNKSPLFVDYAYIQYDPIEWLVVRGGKVKGKTQVWNTSDLIWDGDYNPDGLNATAKTELSEKTKLSANAGWYTFGEGKQGKMLADAYILQPVVEFQESNIKVKAGLAYQQFNFAGRTNAGTGLIKNYDFKVVNPSVSVDVADVVNSLSLGIYGDYAQNIQKDLPQVGGKDAVTGYLIGAKFGHAKTEKLGTWNINAMYRYLELYAIPEGLGDSDSYGGKAGKGYEVVLTFGLTKALSFGIDYYQMTDINGNAPKSLCQFDFVCKF